MLIGRFHVPHTLRVLEPALYYSLGHLSEPLLTREFL